MGVADIKSWSLGSCFVCVTVFYGKFLVQPFWTSPYHIDLFTRKGDAFKYYPSGCLAISEVSDLLPVEWDQRPSSVCCCSWISWFCGCCFLDVVGNVFGKRARRRRTRWSISTSARYSGSSGSLQMSTRIWDLRSGSVAPFFLLFLVAAPTKNGLPQKGFPLVSCRFPIEPRQKGYQLQQKRLGVSIVTPPKKRKKKSVFSLVSLEWLR